MPDAIPVFVQEDIGTWPFRTALCGGEKEAPDERFVGWGERFVWRQWKITLKEV